MVELSDFANHACVICHNFCINRISWTPFLAHVQPFVSFQVEDEMERMLENAHEKFVTPLEAFRKEHIGSVKKTKKDFEVRSTEY